MTLFDMYSLIEFIGNKNFNGNIIPPERFAELIKVVNIDLFRKKYGLPEEYQPGRPIPIEFADITIKNTDDLKAFKIRLPNRTITNGVMNFPSDYVHLMTVVYNYSKTINGVATLLPRPIEMLRESEFSSREGNYTKKPTIQNPIGIIRNDGIHIRPLTILACDLNYYKLPRTPLFNYIMEDGYITYDSVNSIEMEWPIDEHLTLTRMCLEYVGVNLREGDLVDYANTKLKEG